MTLRLTNARRVLQSAWRASRQLLGAAALAASAVLSTDRLNAQSTLPIGDASAFPIGSFGSAGSVAIGQTFKVPVATCALACYLQSFSFWLTPSEQPGANSAALEFRAYVAEWDGAKAAVGTVTTVAGVPFGGPLAANQRYDFAAPNFAINPGSLYVAFLSTVGFSLGTDVYTDFDVFVGTASPFDAGDLVYTNAGSSLGELTDTAWEYTGGAELQTRFEATFTSNVVPEPSSSALIAIGVLGLAIVSRRRRA